MVEVVPKEVSRRVHLFPVAARSGVGQLRLVGGRARFGVEDPEPSGRGRAMARQKDVVLFALDLPDEEPADLLLRVLVRVCDDSVVAGSGEGHEREDPLVHCALD